MKAFVAAIAAALILAVGSVFLLDSTWQRPASTAFTTEGARIDDPGRNLIGDDGMVGRRS